MALALVCLTLGAYLGSDAEAVLELAGLDLGVAAQHADATARAGAQALEDFDGGGLTGAVGAEHAKNFAGTHFEIDALNGGETAVGLLEGFHLDGIVHEFSSFSQAGGGGLRSGLFLARFLESSC